MAMYYTIASRGTAGTEPLQVRRGRKLKERRPIARSARGAAGWRARLPPPRNPNACLRTASNNSTQYRNVNYRLTLTQHAATPGAGPRPADKVLRGHDTAARDRNFTYGIQNTANQHTVFAELSSRPDRTRPEEWPSQLLPFRVFRPAAALGRGRLALGRVYKSSQPSAEAWSAHGLPDDRVATRPFSPRLAT